MRDLIFLVTGCQTYIPHHSGFWRRARHKARRTALPCWPGGHVWLVCPCKTEQAWRSPPPGGTYSYHYGHEAACGNKRGKLHNNLRCVSNLFTRCSHKHRPNIFKQDFWFSHYLLSYYNKVQCHIYQNQGSKAAATQSQFFTNHYGFPRPTKLLHFNKGFCTHPLLTLFHSSTIFFFQTASFYCM